MGASEIASTIIVLMKHTHDDIETIDLPAYFEEYDAERYNLISRIKDRVSSIYFKVSSANIRSILQPSIEKSLKEYGNSLDICKELIDYIIIQTLKEPFINQTIDEIFIQEKQIENLFDERETKEISRYLKEVLNLYLINIETNKDKIVESCVE